VRKPRSSPGVHKSLALPLLWLACKVQYSWERRRLAGDFKQLSEMTPHGAKPPKPEDSGCTLDLAQSIENERLPTIPSCTTTGTHAKIFACFLSLSGHS